MRNNLLLTLLMLATVTFAQHKMITKTGRIVFEASVPLFEEITAKNEGVTCVFNAKTGEIESLVLIKGFRFKIPLMEEHFNANYIESNKYPKARFKGRIANFRVNTLTTEAKEYSMKGKLQMHGKTKEVIIMAKIRKTDSGIEILSNFDLNADDYGIEIPSIVKSKVSNKVILNTSFTVI